MSDFLANLIERSSESAPLLQRRRRSLFEPAEAIPELSTLPEVAKAADDATVATNTVSAVAVPAPVRATAPQGATPALRATQAAPAVVPSMPPLHAALPQAARPVAEETRPQRAAPSIDDARTPATAATTHNTVATAPPTPARATVLPQPELRALRAATPRDADSDMAQGARRSLREAAPAPVAAPPVPDTRAALTAQPTHEPAPRAALLPTMPPQPALQSLAAKLATPAAATAEPAAAPAPVSIHIGRIELRATLTANNERSPRTAAPRLGLADYLRGRHGGRP